MRYSVLAAAVLTAAVLVLPLQAQDNNLTLGVFVTVRAENVPDFEDALREHASWHADQNDTQAWPAYQALTGHGEYAILAPNMSFATLDAPTVDMGTDVAAWASQGGAYAETEETVLWATVPGGNPPADPTSFPVAQVFEFEVQPNGQPAVMEGIERFSEAMADSPFHWQWSSIISADGPPAVFIALWFESFSGMTQMGDGPAQVMSDTFGPEKAAMIMNTFGEAVTVTASQIWMLRPDLSYVPN